MISDVNTLLPNSISTVELFAVFIFLLISYSLFGSTVKVYDINNDKEIIYKIVGNLESDPENGVISIETPIAKGLVGKYVDDEINIKTPSGQIDYEILEVKHK